MRVFKTDEDFWEYAAKDTFLVVPITEHVRKDGGLVLVDDFAKEASTKYPDLQKRWGYFLSNNVSSPTYRRMNVNLLGLPDRSHYASKPNPETVESSLYLLKEVCEENPVYLFYLYGELGGAEFREMHERILTNERIILLEREKNEQTADV